VVWYYCEFCNRNVQILRELDKDIQKKPICETCGHFLVKGTITQQERERRKKERTTYCPNCNQLVYSVPIGVIRNEYYQKIENSNLGCFVCCTIFFFLDVLGTLITFIVNNFQFPYLIMFLVFLGIFTIFLLITIKIYNNEKIKKEEIDTYIRNLKYEWFCTKCLDGVELNKKPPSDLNYIVKNKQQKVICPFCGKDNPNGNKFCGECGNKLL